MDISRLAGLSLLGGVVISILALFLTWIFAASVPVIALAGVAGFIFGFLGSVGYLYTHQ